LQQAVIRAIAQQIVPALCGFACLPKGGSVSKNPQIWVENHTFNGFLHFLTFS